MKKLLFLITLIIFIFYQSVHSQFPLNFNYQAIARNSNNDVLVNTILFVKIGITTDPISDELDWEEIHEVQTNEYGLFTLKVGDINARSGGTKALFSDIDWANGQYYMNVQVDIGNGYNDMGTSQLVAVPYALVANEAISVDDADADPNNELIHTTSLNGTILEITDAGGVRQVDLSPLQNGMEIVGLVPIGGIIPWVKDLPGVPPLNSNFVECNGQVLDDPESLLHGEIIPNLNGENRFLRGNYSSGSVAGHDSINLSHNHKMWEGEGEKDDRWGIRYEDRKSYSFDEDGNKYSGRVNDNTDGYTNNQLNTIDIKPPYFEVVWVIRIK